MIGQILRYIPRYVSSLKGFVKFWLILLQLLVAGQGSTGASPPLISPGSSTVAPGGVSPNSNSAPAGGSTGSGTSCCDTGRPLITDPVSGQTVCSCQYDSARLALSSYPRLSAPGVYGAPYPSTDQNPYPSIGVDSSAFYSPLVSLRAGVLVSPHVRCIPWLLANSNNIYVNWVTLVTGFIVN